MIQVLKLCNLYILDLKKKLKHLVKLIDGHSPVQITKRVENLTKAWYDFIDLVIGYKLHTAQERANYEKTS